MILYPVLGKASPFGVSWSLSLARFPEEQREFDTVKVFSKRGTICHDTVWEAAPGDLLPETNPGPVGGVIPVIWHSNQ